MQNDNSIATIFSQNTIKSIWDKYNFNLNSDEKYIIFIQDLNDLIINIKDNKIEKILIETIKIFFELVIPIDEIKIQEMTNLLSKLYNKLKRLDCFSLLISYFHEIENVKKKILKTYDFPGFKITEDILLKTIFLEDDNSSKNNEIKYRINFNSTTQEKYKYLVSVIENEIWNKERLYFDYDLIVGTFNEGYTLDITIKDEYLILNDEENGYELISDLKKLLENYGIDENNLRWNWEGADSFFYSRRKRLRQKLGDNNYSSFSSIKTKKAINLLTEEEKVKKEEDEKIRIEKWNKVRESFQKDEIYIKNSFKLTKRNTTNFKKAFNNIKNIILSINDIKDKIISIYPYGSSTQLTYNISSDIEMTLFIKGYQNIKDIKDMGKDEVYNSSPIYQILSKIRDKVEKDHSSEYLIYDLRTTKRTILLCMKDIKLNVELEINCNNFFSVMNSNLIRNYLVYDARVLILLDTIKSWSKLKKINSNHRGHLSSYCYTLMTIFFLQKLKEPLLPTLSSPTKDIKQFIVHEKEYFIEKQLLQSSEIMKKWHTNNNEDTVSTLLLKWMIFYLYLFPQNDYCIDVRNKKLTLRFEEAAYLNISSDVRKDSAYVFIDMFDYTYNPGAYLIKNSIAHDLFKDTLKKGIVKLLEGDKNIFEEEKDFY